MAYREAEILEFCVVCAADTHGRCRQCLAPCCGVHISVHGHCPPCEVTFYETSVVRDRRRALIGGGAGTALYAGMVLVGVPVLALVLLATGTVAGIGLALVERRERRRELMAARRLELS